MSQSYGTTDSYTVRMQGPFGSVESSGKITQVTLPAENWKNAESPYFQTVEIYGISESSQVQIQATIEQIERLCADGTAISIVNDAGVATAKAIGTKPTEDLIFQVTLMEVVSA
jgi:hypothetical protein